MAKYGEKDFSSLGEDREAWDEYLLSLGKIPLQVYVLYILLFFVYEVVLYFHIHLVVGLSSIDTIVFCGYMLSYGLLGAGYSYVSLDRFVLTFLNEQNITYYPVESIVGRQKSKWVIVPNYMVLSASILSIFVTVNSIYKMPASGVLGKSEIFHYIIKANSFPLLLFIVLSAALVIRASKNMGMLMTSINDRLAEMVSGDKDLTKRIAVSSIDELGAISRYINMFSDIVTDHMGETRQVYGALADKQHDLNTSVNDSSLRMGEITGLLDRNREITEAGDMVVAGSINTGRTLAENVSRTVEYVGNQSRSVEESSAAVEEMIASITEVSKRTERVKENTDQLALDFDQGGESVNKTIEAISGVSDLSESLIGINNMISGIAAKTNLLAMNAAIEAAHAGDAGRGFSVVADEIRTLAENTTIHTKSSAESLRTIMEQIRTSLGVAEATGIVFERMKEGVEHIREESLSIADSMAEHDTANREVLNQLVTTRDLSGKLNELGEALAGQSRSLLQAFEQLESNSKASLDNSREIMDKNSSVKESLTKLTEIAAETEDLNRKTGELVSSFKVSL
ncbi:MAG: methyl-accepting chemotaxis protein [Spirochaetales bacterium]|nr:methyl-accepting chemotaxis protein [Spirochaetales bacterium]